MFVFSSKFNSLVENVFDNFFENVSNRTGIQKQKISEICLSMKPKEAKVKEPKEAKVKEPKEAKVKEPKEVKVKEPKEAKQKESKKDKDFKKAASSILEDMLEEKNINTYTITKLKQILASKNLKQTGTKKELISRIQNPQVTDNMSNASKKKARKILFKPKTNPDIINKLKNNVSKLSIRKNSEGFYVHEDTNLVFDPKTQKVIGKWKNGHIQWLVSSDINMCQELGVLYELPENLDYGTVKIVDKKVEEILGEDDFKEEIIEEDEEDEDAEDNE